MSERYSRLFTLPENLYAAGSPVVIAAGTLLKDTQTGKIIAQLKLKSISEKSIKAVKVKLNLFDTAGNALEESVVHDYLDLNVARDVEFGQKNPVMVPNVKARSYKASVAEVVFVDRSVWTSEVGNWEPLSKPSRLTFHDYELQRQYEIKFGGGSVYEVKSEKDLWHCTCGALNRDGEVCHVCHNTLLALQTLDMSALEKEKDARLAEEARVAAEREKKSAEELAARKDAAKEAQKKTAKFLKIAIPAVCAVIAIVLLITKVLIPNKQYNDAVALMDAGNVIEAYEALIAMDGYKDSAEKADSIHYEYNIEKMKIAKVGDYVVFGTYEQDNNASNGTENIEWIVLEIKDGKALVISRYGLDSQRYHTNRTDITWETCSLRKWLNDDFINSAFSDKERAIIPTATVAADKNTKYDTDPGKATQDQVFLLSHPEVKRYFRSDVARQCVPTVYAVARGVYENGGGCNWWLRSPGWEPYTTTYVVEDGDIYDTGGNVDGKILAVRPAMWIDLTAAQ